MTNRIHRALIVSAGAVALMLAASATIAEAGTAQGVRIASGHPAFRPAVAHNFGHRRGNIGGVFWPGDYDYGSYGPSDSGPTAGAPPPPSGDVHYTYTYDVPWDWAHRYPPSFTAAPSQPAARPYVPGCRGQAVMVPGADGKNETVNIIRCY
jgi:hypothetical protein